MPPVCAGPRADLAGGARLSGLILLENVFAENTEEHSSDHVQELTT